MKQGKNTPNSVNVRLTTDSCIWGLSLMFVLFGHSASAKAEDLQVATYLEDKVQESITSPLKRFRDKSSHRFQSFKSRIKNRRQIEAETAKSLQENQTAKASADEQNTETKSFYIEPEISPVRPAPQFDAQVDAMILAHWKRPDRVTPEEWEQILSGVKEASRKTGIPQQIVMSLINKESGFNPNAVSRSGAIGLTQLMPATALYECGLRRGDLYDINKNIHCGVSYLDKMLQTFKRVDLAIAAYNAGPGAVRRAIEQSGSNDIDVVTARLKPETAPYVRKILASINYGNDCI